MAPSACVPESAKSGTPIDRIAGRSIKGFDQLSAYGTLEVPPDAGPTLDRVDGSVWVRYVRSSVAPGQIGGPNGEALFDYPVGVSLGPLMSDEF